MRLIVGTLTAVGLALACTCRCAGPGRRECRHAGDRCRRRRRSGPSPRSRATNLLVKTDKHEALLPKRELHRSERQAAVRNDPGAARRRDRKESRRRQCGDRRRRNRQGHSPGLPSARSRASPTAMSRSRSRTARRSPVPQNGASRQCRRQRDDRLHRRSAGGAGPGRRPRRIGRRRNTRRRPAPWLKGGAALAKCALAHPFSESPTCSLSC